MKIIPEGRPEWQRSATFLTAYPLLILVCTHFLLFHRDCFVAVAYMHRAPVFVIETILALGLLIVSVALLVVRPKLGLTGLAFLALGILVFMMTPAVTICY